MNGQLGSNFEFASPSFLSLLLLIPTLWWWQRRQTRWSRPAGLRFARVAAARTAHRPQRAVLQPLLPLLRLASMALIIVGLARPQTIQAHQIVQGEGVDIALALDISGSMASLDFQPRNRLEAAKSVIAEFVQERPFDRIGLVIFASNAFNQSPPTVDHAVLQRMLGQSKLATELQIQDGTAIGMGLANAANMLKDSDAASKVVILLTDGVNNAGSMDPLTAAQAANALGIKVYTVGMGRPGQVPVPVVDAFGREMVVMQESALDEATLQQVAEATGGRYFRAEDSVGLRRTYDEINELETSRIEIETHTNHQELVGWLLAPGLLLLLAETALRQTWLRTLP